MKSSGDNSVDCWFCFERYPSQIIKANKKGFYCPNCEQYNGFTDKTPSGYNIPRPELYDSDLNDSNFRISELDLSEERELLKQQSHLNSIFYQPIKFCTRCVLSQNTSSKLGSNFHTCPDCRQKVIERLKLIHHKTNSLYKNDVRKGGYTRLEKIQSVVYNLSLLFMIPLYAVLIILDMNGVRDVGWLYVGLYVLLIPSVFHGFLYIFITVLLLYNKRVYMSMIVSIVKIVYDEYRRVRICSKCESENEKRECYLYDNLFNVEDNKKPVNIKLCMEKEMLENMNIIIKDTKVRVLFIVFVVVLLLIYIITVYITLIKQYYLDGLYKLKLLKFLM